MSSSKKRVTFEYRPAADIAPGKPYHCIKVTNSLEYQPGNWYDAKEVQSLCDRVSWDVTIVN